MKRLKLIMSALLFMTALPAMSDTVIIDKLEYECDSAAGTATLVSASNAWQKDSIAVPNSIFADGKEYKVTVIGTKAFEECKNLKSVTISDSVITISWGAFYQCYGLRKAVIGNSVRIIESHAFYSCGLENVVFGKSVARIGESAFDSNYNLKSMRFLGTVPPKCDDLYGYGGVLMYVPQESVSLYQHYFPYSHIVGYESQKNIGIALERPGTLSEELKSIPAADYSCIVGLKLSGDINGLDFAALTKLSNIMDLDLSEANLMNGGNYDHVLNSNKLVGLPLLRNLKLPESLLRIDKNAIDGFQYLESVSLGSSLEKLEERGINDCGSIKKVYCMNPVPPEFENRYGSLAAGRATLYVPDGCRRAYWMHQYWGEFRSVEQLGESSPGADYSDVMTIDPECTEIEKNGLHGTYLKIPDSDEVCTIDYEQNTQFTNRKLYVGRTLRTMVTGIFAGEEYDIYREFKTRWKIGDAGLDEVEFGPLATILPYKEFDYKCYENHSYIPHYGMGIGFPFAIKPGGVVRFNGSKIEMPVRKDGKEVGGMFIVRYDSDTQKHEGVNFVISDNCVELPGKALSPIHTYIKVEAMNPPQLSSNFNKTDIDKMLIVPDGTKQIYSVNKYWGRFRNIQEASSPDAAVALQGVKADLRSESFEMHIEGGMLYIDGEIPEGAELEVYSADGILLYRGHDKAVEVPAGVLIVRCGSRVGKIIRQ